MSKLAEKEYKKEIVLFKTLTQTYSVLGDQTKGVGLQGNSFKQALLIPTLPLPTTSIHVCLLYTPRIPISGEKTNMQ